MCLGYRFGHWQPEPSTPRQCVRTPHKTVKNVRDVFCGNTYAPVSYGHSYVVAHAVHFHMDIRLPSGE